MLLMPRMRARNVGRCCPRYGDHAVNENRFDKTLLILTYAQKRIHRSLQPERSDTMATSLEVLDVSICAFSSCSVWSCFEVTITRTLHVGSRNDQCTVRGGAGGCPAHTPRKMCIMITLADSAFVQRVARSRARTLMRGTVRSGSGR